MKKTSLATYSLFAFSLLLSSSLFAAPKGGAKGAGFETVAEGYCAWSGFTDENRIMGRDLYPSDMRHKLVAVFYVDAAKYADQLKEIAKAYSQFNPRVNFFTGAETAVIPRDKVGLVVLVGKEIPDGKTLNKFFNGDTDTFAGCNWNIYTNVKGSKIPDHGGKFPFYCVFGPEPGDPLASGVFDDKASKKLGEIRKNKKNYLQNWKPYYGTVEEPKAVKGFAKKLASGKPLDPLVAECQKGISNKDPEKAKECQILYDALEQTKNDYLFDVQTFARSCPTRAIYEAEIVMRQFQKTKKVLKAKKDQMMSIPDVSSLYKMFCQLKKWSDEDFKCKNAAEAKKCEAELLKMKKTCDGIIEKSKVNAVQSAAAWIGNEAEMLAPQMAGKVPAK